MLPSMKDNAISQKPLTHPICRLISHLTVRREPLSVPRDRPNGAYPVIHPVPESTMERNYFNIRKNGSLFRRAMSASQLMTAAEASDPGQLCRLMIMRTAAPNTALANLMRQILKQPSELTMCVISAVQSRLPPRHHPAVVRLN